MNDIRLVAWREFLQYLRARGFLLTLLLVPLWIVVSALLHHMVTAEEPLRIFAVVDDAGGFTAAIDHRLAVEEAGADLRVLQDWAAQSVDLDPLARSAPALAMILRRDAGDSEAAEAFLASGGFDGAVAAMRGHLPPGAEMPTQPSPRLLRIDAPADIAGPSAPAMPRRCCRCCAASVGCPCREVRSRPSRSSRYRPASPWKRRASIIGASTKQTRRCATSCSVP